jgi:hypothetical protein
MTGSTDLIPVMVDCLRALGRHRDALHLVDEGTQQIEDPSMRVELIIVHAGVRVDMGEREEGLRILRRELEHPTVRHPRLAQARLLYAYADLVAQAGDLKEAYRGFSLAARLDVDATTGALDRLDEMDGIVLELDEEEFADEESEEEESEEFEDETDEGENEEPESEDLEDDESEDLDE